MHEPAVAVKPTTTPRDRTTAVPAADASCADSGAAAEAAANHVGTAPATAHVAAAMSATTTATAVTVRESNRGQ